LHVPGPGPGHPRRGRPPPAALSRGDLRRERDRPPGHRGALARASGPLPALVTAAAVDPAAIIRAMEESSPRDVAEQPSLEELKRQLDEKQDRLLRALADIENLRRRSQRDREEYVKYANESLLRDLVPVLDNFDRAVAAARAGGAAGTVVEGIELIQRELLRVLERHGVTRYSAVGQPFDPSRHEAIARVVSTEQRPDTVVSETATGYLLHGRVLRPALVA